MVKKSPTPDWSRFRNLLLKIRERLSGDIRQLGDETLLSVDDASGGNRLPNHPADHGSESYNQEFDLGLLENDEQTLMQVDLALERIREGNYGTCAECEKSIPKRRLEVIPYTPYCVDCASKQPSSNFED